MLVLLLASDTIYCMNVLETTPTRIMPDQPAHHDHHYKRTIIIISIAIVIIICAAVIVRGIFPSRTERIIANDPAMAESAAFFKEHSSTPPITDAEIKETQAFFKKSAK